MNSVSRALNRLPLPLYFIVFFGLLVLVRVGLRELFDGGRMDETQLVAGLVVALLVAAIATFAVARQRRRLGGPAGVEHYAAAVRSGRIPDGVDTTGWVPQLEARQRRARYNLWRGVVLSVVILALGVLIVTTSGRAGAGGWILVVLALLSGPALVLLARRERRRVRALLDRLDTGSPVAATPPRG